MSDVRPFHVAFLTNFSECCFRAIPALARMSDELAMRLTIVHAHEGHALSGPRLDDRLHSFFPEADRYALSARRLVQGTPAEAVRTLQEDDSVDLVIAPAGEPLGLPRFVRNSVRSELLHAGGPPVWTIGPGAVRERVARPVRNVACCIDVGAKGRAHLRLACDYAATLGATLHVIHLLPPVNEGSLLHLAYARPFDPGAIKGEIQRMVTPDAFDVRVHVLHRRYLASMLDATCEPDVVFVDGRRWMQRRWLAQRMSRTLDLLPCPVVFADGTQAGLGWQVARKERSRVLPWPGLAITRPGRPARVAALTGTHA